MEERRLGVEESFDIKSDSNKGLMKDGQISFESSIIQSLTNQKNFY